ncbi:hypothetical protein [Nonomuraea typhae]|uniref:hypothetical protein n=1 Tax=Nonomuraea typhae TaxID=2603600 RepID=UPI0012F89058|nr:hypothetical protein [Nonomuraea typhae]
MIDDHIHAEIDALKAATGLALRVAPETATARRLRDHADDLIGELGRAGTWPRLRRARQEADRLRAEALDYAHAVMLRGHPLGEDDGPARALARHLCERAGLPGDVEIIASSGPESFTRVADLIRLPPHADVWHLPVLAHELGHYVIHEARHVRAGDERPIRDRAATSPQNELIADCYATYAIGPAYPLSCICLRIDPQELDLAAETHPPWRVRVHTMAEMLHLMSRQHATQQYGGAVESWIRPAWKELTGEDAIDPGGHAVPMPASAILRLLERHLPRARYDAGYGVDGAERVLAGERNVRRSGISPAHVLNAAWRLRRDGRHGPEVNRRAMTLLLEAA